MDEGEVKQLKRLPEYQLHEGTDIAEYALDINPSYGE